MIILRLMSMFRWPNRCSQSSLLCCDPCWAHWWQTFATDCLSFCTSHVVLELAHQDFVEGLQALTVCPNRCLEIIHAFSKVFDVEACLKTLLKASVSSVIQIPLSPLVYA